MTVAGMADGRSPGGRAAGPRVSSPPMRTLPVLSLVTAAIVVGFVAWRARGAHDGFAAGATGTEPTGPSVEVAADAPLDPDALAASRALKEADAPPSPAQSRALDTAIQKLDQLVAREPQNAEYVFYRGIAATMARDESGSSQFLGRLATVSPLKERDARFVYLKAIGLLAFQASKPDPAVRLLQVLRAEAPTFMPEPVNRALHRALMQASVVRSEPQSRDEAVKLMLEAVALVRTDPRLLAQTQRVLARTYIRAQRFHEAEEIWRSLVEQHGERDVDAMSGLANTIAMQDRFDEAVVAFTQVLGLLERGAIAGDAGVPEARLRRGNCYRLLGRLDEARADLERYVAEHPDDHRGVHWLGMLWFDGHDDPAKALPYLERSYRAAPWCEVYGRVLLQLYEVRMPDPAKAASLRREMEANASAHQAKMAALAKESRDGVSICR